MTIDDAIKNLTTEILSDNAPDVIMLDGLDIDNLCENNVLLDLSEYENIWNPNNNLLDNVAKWNEKDGLYSVACKFRIPAVAANKETLENLNSFTELADQSEFWRKKYNDEHPFIYFEKPETVIRLGLMYCGTSILDENNLDRNALESFFDNCSRLYNNDQHSVYYRGYSSESNYPNVNDENLFAMRLGCCFGTEHAIAVGTINTFMLDLNIAESIENSQNKYDVDYKFGITDEIRSFVPNCNLAIVQSDSNKTDAINFIALALNTNIQKINLNDGFPVNTETLNWFYEKNKNINDTVSYATCDAQNNTIETFIVEWMDDDEASEFDSYIKSLDEPIIIDNITRSIIEDIGNRCINGDITPGEAADEVIKKIKLKGKE